MPSYFYHLKFELYPTPTPDPSTGNTTERSSRTNNPGTRADNIWFPSKNASVFDRLPVHRRTSNLALSCSRKPTSSPIASTDSQLQQGVIDCGTPRPANAEADRNFVLLRERQHRQRTLSIPPPKSDAAIKPEVATKDWRFDQLRIESLDIGTPREGNYKAMAGAGASNSTTSAAAVGPSMSDAGIATKARYVPFKTTNTELGWGIVHLYKEADETPGLDIAGHHDEPQNSQEQLREVDCTTLCIPAVPSYLSASDFLGFIGDKWRDEISHYRMVMTGRMNRYLVLLKFRESKRAQQFRHEFDGKVFNHIEPETCNVACIKSITFETPTRPQDSFPDLSHDPFTPSTTSSGLKPLPPPTPNLTELPTCPVCLERMDDTTGLLTIPCQHVFHCSCLQKWKGSGCPVCRHTNPSLAMSIAASGSGHGPSSSSHDSSDPFSTPFGSHVSNLCSVCDSPDDLWICLICGNVGCGRYKGGHAKEHWKDTAHTFALELDTQYVWDYMDDAWVHRLIRTKGDGKVVELPGHRQDSPHRRSEDDDVVPKAKLESIGVEYTHLLASQLDSQRVYFEAKLSEAADKAMKASAAAEKATSQATQVLEELRAMREEHRVSKDTVPALEKDLTRERVRATKSTDLARNLGKNLQEEKKVSEGLMKRIEHVNKELETLRDQMKRLELENADLKDQNHDLTMFISGQEKLKEMEAEGQIDQEDLQEGSAVVPEKKGRRNKGKGRA
ncbi:Zn-finger in ubiquitin-hydrolase [Truncatella angustata]|uniref:Zn-finger in ubiquitin-hydrolase n=1 Tax=Truncatella angustata TaxID=152316 RepID=A0A9P8UDY2_9PEZI|nr:Zn-finger in ubiquitin-hydrolase [Truncatella angustata]KAH6648148.1 Zn-finger in ubiquitin-hydrolase [Truncatella angustata]